MEFNLLSRIFLKGGSLLLLITLTLISTASCTVNVTYLRGVPRLNITSYWDYYFFCNTVGTTLIWEVNGTGLNGFQSGGLGEALYDTRPSFAYTATLLSSKPTTGGQFTFDSILMVSVAGSSSLDVVCSNGPSSNRTSNVDNGKGVENSNSTNSVFEEYLLTDSIVGDQTSQTSIFICGVQNSSMYWHTGTSNELGFSEFDSIGERRQNLEPGATTVKEQAIVIAHEPYQIVSVFFVTATSDVTVTCGYDQNEVSLTSRYDSSTSVPTVQTDPEIVSSTTLGTSTGGGTEIITSKSSTDTITPSDSSTLLYIVIGVVIAVVLVLCAVMIAMVAYIIYEKKREQQPQPMPLEKPVELRVIVTKEPHSDHSSEESDEAVPPIEQQPQPMSLEKPVELRVRVHKEPHSDHSSEESDEAVPPMSQDYSTKSRRITRNDSVRLSDLSMKSVTLQQVSDPSNLINDKHSSFHGALTGVEAKEILNSKGGHCYLVRYSKKQKTYALCVRYTNGTEASVAHFQLVVKNKKFWLDEKEIFESLDDLLSHYKDNQLTEEISNIGEECKSA